MKNIVNKSMLAAALCIASSTAFSANIVAPSPQDKMSGDNKVVAMYGNSYTHYNNNLNTRLRDLTRSLLPNNAKGYSYRGITISSGKLGWHKKNLEFQNTLKDWDVVIFQGNSMESISKEKDTREYFQQSAIEMADIAHKAGSKIVYFMTWAEESKPEQTMRLKDAYLDIAKKTGGYVAPVGLAFKNVIKQHPDLELYFVDGKHPSLAGTYLAASVFFAVLYNKSPVGGDIPVGSDMSKETAIKLQKIAWETVTEFQQGK